MSLSREVSNNDRERIWLKMVADGLPLVERRVAMFVLRQPDAAGSIPRICEALAGLKRDVTDERVSRALPRVRPYIAQHELDVADQIIDVSA